MTFKPTLLARIHKSDSHRLEGYRADGGYEAFARLLKEKGKGRGLISVCTAGGMGVTAVLER